MKPDSALGTLFVQWMTLMSTCAFSSTTGSTTSAWSQDETNDILPYGNQSDGGISVPVNDASEDCMTYPPAGSPVFRLSCYKCGAYQNRAGVDFKTALDDCMNRAAETAETEECPTIVASRIVRPSCYVNIITAAGHISSISRGCMVHYNCSTLNDCETHPNRTGACQTCCRQDFCNRAAGERVQRVHVMGILFLSLFSYFVFVR